MDANNPIWQKVHQIVPPPSTVLNLGIKRRWCPTQLDPENRNMIPYKWGFCSQNCPDSKVYKTKGTVIL